MTDDTVSRPFPSARQDVTAARKVSDSPQTLSPSYSLAFADPDFLLRDDLRPVRLQLELLKPELALRDHRINSTVVVFGSGRIPDPLTAKERQELARKDSDANPSNIVLRKRARIADKVLRKSRYYEEARKFARLVSLEEDGDPDKRHVIITGGGGGIMEAANRGAHDVKALNIGLNIVLPFEQAPNQYITPELSFQFHYFAIRKMHFLMRARALAIFPGGFGTLDELFDALTLIQTGKIKAIPVLLFGKQYWTKIIDFEAMAEEGVIAPEDVDLITYVESADEGCRAISSFYENTE